MKYIDHFQEANSVFLVCEYCSGGDLDQFICKNWKHWENSDMREPLKIIYQVGVGVYFLHKQGFAHRDLKPRNVLIHQGVFKIADFGFASSSSVMESDVGTPLFKAPEFFRFPMHYNKKVDVWALGSMLYLLLANEPFSNAGNRIDLQDEILYTLFQILPKYRSKWSNSLQELLLECFKKNPAQRPSIKEFLDHSVFDGIREGYSRLRESVKRDAERKGGMTSHALRDSAKGKQSQNFPNCDL